jgi:hypothetical protein
LERSTVVVVGWVLDVRAAVAVVVGATSGESSVERELPPFITAAVVSAAATTMPSALPAAIHRRFVNAGFSSSRAFRHRGLSLLSHQRPSSSTTTSTDASTAGRASI